MEKIIKDAQGERWKTFEPIIVIKHPILQGKYLAIDGNHRLGAFKIRDIPKIKAMLIDYKNILLAAPKVRHQQGVVPHTTPLVNAINKNLVDLKKYFNTKDLKVS